MEDCAEDYPFTSWDSFKEALLLSLQTEFFDEEYPKYYEADTSNLSIIKRLLKTSNAQTILDDIIEMTVSSGQRYAKDCILGIGDSSDIIDFLLRKGAVFPWHIVFDLPDDEEIDDNYNGLEHRATLIDMYAPELKPEIPDEILNAEPCDFDDDDATCAGIIKYNSSYIQ